MCSRVGKPADRAGLKAAVDGKIGWGEILRTLSNPDS